MTGYVRPYKPELRFREFSLYRAAYCGLCDGLKRYYGFLSRLLLSYDMTFALLLLSGGDGERCYKRCLLHPVKKRCRLSCEVSRAVCDATVLLAFEKLRDDRADGERRLRSTFFLLLFRRARDKAARSLPEFARELEARMAALREGERRGEGSLDAMSEHFARCTAALAALGVSGDRRALSVLLYHLGRWIYIIDACDDFEKDMKRRKYNPVAARFGDMDGENRAELRLTLSQSRETALSAFELISRGESGELIRNILTFGMSDAERRVLGEEE